MKKTLEHTIDFRIHTINGMPYGHDILMPSGASLSHDAIFALAPPVSAATKVADAIWWQGR